MADIFISYSRPDRPRVANLAAALEKAGYDVWWDMNLTGGAQFSKETGEKLREAKAVVVAWSETSINSMWVADEATVGRTKGNLVPIAIDNVEPPLGFGQIHALDFSHWTGDETDPEFVALNNSLSLLLNRDPPAKPEGAVVEWKRFARVLTRQWKPAVVALALFSAALIGAFLFTHPLAETESGLKAIEDGAIAVMPFINAGAEDDDYLSEGVADELRLQLARVAGLKVAARASSIAFLDEKTSASAIARRLGVARLVEGSLRKVAGEIQVSVEIIDGRTGFQVWSERFSGSPNDLLAVQQKIATAVVAQISSESEPPAPATTDITAFDKLLLARHYEQEVRDAQVVDEEKLSRSIDLYRAAVDADPNSALARSRLAAALLYAGDADGAEPEIFKALTLNPNDSEVQCTLGLFYFARNMPGVAAAYERALALSPNNPDALTGLARARWTIQPREKTEDLFRRALDLDPMSLARYGDLGHFLGVTGQRAKALEIVEDIAARFPTVEGYLTIAQILDRVGDIDLAILAAKKALTLNPAAEDPKAQIAELYAEIGDIETAAQYEPEPGIGQLYFRRDYERLIDLAEDLAIDQPEEAQIWYMLGHAYAVTGDFENAIRVLKIAGAEERARSESNVGNDLVAMSTLMMAQAAVGERAEAQEIAEYLVKISDRMLEYRADQGWWANNLKACALTTLGRKEEALAAIALTNKGPGLTRISWIRDMPCYRSLQDDARYEKALADAEKRKADLRARVAETGD